MIIVHHLNKSRSKRILWLLEELQMPYHLVQHQRDPQTNLAPDSLKVIHPLAKAPVIVDGELTLCESGAVVEYILNNDTQNRLRPQPDSAEYYQYLEWLHFAEGSLALPVIAKLMMSMEERVGDQAMDHYIGKEINLDFSYIEAVLSKQSYFAGEQFSGADIMMTIMLEIACQYRIVKR
ncbi:glutathione S-transferase family protein [Psychromonas sp. KJ10-10]|uniref:glutathione S-transferase family protein n=1 Tax=Psychromonas sp. KJ10-10 TaxID=3391823 RepID=UPI0039B49D25